MSPTDSASTPAPLVSSFQELQIVIVDDCAEDRGDAKQLLLEGSTRRYVFAEAETATAGVDLCRRLLVGAPGCLLLDYLLPDMNAPEMLAALLGPESSLLCPVVVLTGFADQDKGRRILRTGAHDFIGKQALSAASLTRAVENAIERWTMAGDLREQRRALEASESRYRKLFEAARENENRLQLALEASRTGIWTWDLTTDAVDWSAECFGIHGLSPGEFAGTGLAFFQLVHAEDRGRVEAAVRGAIENRSLYRCEFRLIRPDGEVVWVENLGHANHGPDGEPVRMLGTITDVSERKKAAEQLMRAEERLAHAWRAAQVGTWDWNIVTGETVGTEQTWRLWGHPACAATVSDDFVDRNIHPEDRAHAKAVAQDSLRSGVYRDVFRVLHPNSAVRWLECEGEVVFDAGGRPSRMLGTIRDVTERQLADEALRGALERAEALVRARDQLVSMVSHDLQGPLAAITLTIDLLKRQARESSQALTAERAATLLDRMSRQALQMARLTEDLLDVARLHAGEPLDLDRQETNLVEIARALAEDHQRSTRKHRIAVRATADVISGSWDAKRLERVVYNLLSNAIKYSPAGGEVEVELDSFGGQDAGWAMLRVSDEGIGIPAADLAHIFEWFSRAANARAATIKGTGIGLAGVRQIVEQHGGSISAESEEGKGSRFTVLLPSKVPESVPP